MPKKELKTAMPSANQKPFYRKDIAHRFQTEGTEGNNLMQHDVQVILQG